jgi:hypothetical protein
MTRRQLHMPITEKDKLSYGCCLEFSVATENLPLPNEADFCGRSSASATGALSHEEKGDREKQRMQELRSFGYPEREKLAPWEEEAWKLFCSKRARTIIGPLILVSALATSLPALAWGTPGPDGTPGIDSNYPPTPEIRERPAPREPREMRPTSVPMLVPWNPPSLPTRPTMSLPPEIGRPTPSFHTLMPAPLQMQSPPSFHTQSPLRTQIPMRSR